MKAPAAAAQRREAGAVMIFTLLILVVGAMVLAGIGQRLATQSLSTGDDFEAANRRIFLANSRALARQYVLSRMFFGEVEGATYSHATWGSFTIEEPNAGNFWLTLSTTDPVNVNPFNLFERGGFYRVQIFADLGNGVGTDTTRWTYTVRTRSPVAAGYSLVMQRPGQLPSSGVTYANNPYINLLGTPFFARFLGLPVVPVSSVTNTTVDPTGYEGYLDVPMGTTQDIFPWAASDLVVTPLVETNPAAGVRVTLNLTNEAIANPLVAKADSVTISSPMFYAGANRTVRQIRMTGTTDPNLRPLRIEIDSTCTDVDVIELDGQNVRSVYVNRVNATMTTTPLFVILTDATDWRIAMTMERTPVTLTAPGLVTIRGGIRTDSIVEVDSTALTVLPDTDPGSLDAIGDRMMWLEDNLWLNPGAAP